MRSLLVVLLLAVSVPAIARASDQGVVRMYVHHEVADYAAWRKVYDGLASRRRTA